MDKQKEKERGKEKKICEIELILRRREGGREGGWLGEKRVRDALCMGLNIDAVRITHLNRATGEIKEDETYTMRLFSSWLEST